MPSPDDVKEGSTGFYENAAVEIDGAVLFGVGYEGKNIFHQNFLANETRSVAWLRAVISRATLIPSSFSATL